MESIAVFTSDVHLSRREPSRTAAWLEFLERIRRRARDDGPIELYILGDLFEYWHEFLTFPYSGYRPVLESFEQTVAAGVPVRIASGNRDFFYGMGAARWGLEYRGASMDLGLFGSRVYASHGDEFCTRDPGYLRWRKVLRSLPLRLLALVVPRCVAFFIAETAMGVSATGKERKGLEALDIQTDAVREMVAGSGYDSVICGHIHTAGRRELVPAGDGSPAIELITLPGWTEKGGTGTVVPDVFEVGPDGGHFRPAMGEQGAER